MKRIVVFIMIAMMASLMGNTAMAQTRKDKKAAEKAQWEAEQKQKAEEDALLHKIKMDSIANVQKAKDEAAKRAEEDRVRGEREKLREETEVNTPCSGPDYYSTSEKIRSTSVRQSMDQQMAKQMARSAALEELGSKISVALEAMINDYFKSTNRNMTEQMERRFEGMVQQTIDQKISGYRTICEKFTSFYDNNNTKNYKCYYAIELGKDDLLKPIHDNLTEDEVLRVDFDYLKFKEEFDKEFEKADKNH